MICHISVILKCCQGCKKVKHHLGSYPSGRQENERFVVPSPPPIIHLPGTTKPACCTQPTTAQVPGYWFCKNSISEETLLGTRGKSIDSLRTCPILVCHLCVGSWATTQRYRGSIPPAQLVTAKLEEGNLLDMDWCLSRALFLSFRKSSQETQTRDRSSLSGPAKQGMLLNWKVEWDGFELELE